MSDTITGLEIITQLLNQRQSALSNSLFEMREYLGKVRDDLSENSETSISHLNTRLFLQVHVTNVIEASQDYDQAVTAYLAEKETERKNRVLSDAGVLPKQ